MSQQPGHTANCDYDPLARRFLCNCKKDSVMSYRPEVIADRSGQWAGNGCVFATREEAQAYVQDLEFRWMMVTATRVVETDAPITAQWKGGRTVHLPAGLPTP
jgi:hypothetical protein